MTETIEPNECQVCIKQRVKDGEEPNQMIALPRLTRKRKLQVFVCPDCDGNVLQLGRGLSNE